MKILPASLSFKANTMSKKQAQHFKFELLNNKNVDIFCHEDSDLDTISSALVMSNYLKNNNVNSRIIYSQDLNSLNLKNPEKYNLILDKDYKKDDKTDTSICLDFSSSGRVAKNVLEGLKKYKNKYGIDHHKGIDLVDSNYIHLKSPMKDSPIESSVDFYIDSSAKSTTSILYRYFEALNEEFNYEASYNMFQGLLDDLMKRGNVKFDKDNRIIINEEFKNDKNAIEVFLELKNRLKDSDINEISKNVNIISSLSDKEKDFQKSLIDNIKLSSNHKIAYVEIPPDSELWDSLGGDNPRTSAILNHFRQEVINNSFKDKIDLSEIQSIIVFYRAKDRYRLSAHSKNDKLLEFFNYFEKNSKTNLTESIGGHKSRGGGKINTLDKNACHAWVMDIISADKFYD